jgi:hypothetical protein
MYGYVGEIKRGDKRGEKVGSIAGEMRQQPISICWSFMVQARTYLAEKMLKYILINSLLSVKCI